MGNYLAHYIMQVNLLRGIFTLTAVMVPIGSKASTTASHVACAVESKVKPLNIKCLFHVSFTLNGSVCTTPGT